MAVEPAIMQVISKSTDYSKEKVNLELFETSIKDIIRKIKGQAGDTLNAVSTGDYISDSLLADIKDKQNYYLSNFDDYITEIEDYADTDPRSDLSPYQVYSYIYSAINTGIIEAEDEILNIILNEIMNNEGFYWERRVSIVNILWYIRGFINDSWAFGFVEADLTKLTAFLLIAKEDLILDDIIDVLLGGDEALYLKTQTISILNETISPVDEVEVTVEIEADEHLYSLDSLTIDIDNNDHSGNCAWTADIYEEKVDVAAAYRDTLQSQGGTMGGGLGFATIYPGINLSTNTTRSLKSTIVLRIAGTTDDCSSMTINEATLKFTTRKISVYT